jgi:hypothetical protein
MDNKFHEAKLNYMNTRNRVLLAENEELQEKLTEEKNFSKLMIFFNVATILIGALLVMGVYLHG